MRERYCRPWNTVESPWLKLHFTKPPNPATRKAAQYVSDKLSEIIRDQTTKDLPESLVNMLLYGQETKP